MNAFQRKFVNEVKRCDEMQRILNHISDEIEKEGIDVKDEDEDVDQDKDGIRLKPSKKSKEKKGLGDGTNFDEQKMDEKIIPHHKDMSMIETSLTKLEYDLVEEIKTFEELKRTYNELIDHRQVLQKNKEFFELVSIKILISRFNN